MSSHRNRTRIVATRSGRLEGGAYAGLEFYRGIPFAAPPTGTRRFTPPEPPPRWTGVRDATRFGPAALQPTVRPTWLRALDRRHLPESEDCLHLNVWTPNSRAAKRPVLVWIHGGGYRTGAGSWFVYAGEHLARRGDLVVVTLNYRLGALGGLNLRALGIDEGMSPNLCLRDQLAALEWVRDNIEAFGGDPDRVTVAGQSAGAMSIGSLLCCERARGLFDRAILQSGAASHVHSKDRAAEIAEHFLAALGTKPSRPDLAKALRGLPTSELLRAQTAAARRVSLPLGTLVWQPSLDDELIPDFPLRRIESGAGAAVPLLLGTTREEWKMFTFSDLKRRRLDRPTLTDYLERTLPRPTDAARAIAIYQHCEETQRRRRSADIWVAFQTDRVFRHPAVQLADAYRKNHATPVFFYRFDYASPFSRDRLGAFHALDVPFVFGTHRHPLLAPVLGAFASARRLSAQMQKAWIAFIRGQDDAGLVVSDSRNDCAATVWPEYESEQRATFLFGTNSTVAHAPEPEALRFWEELASDT